MNIEKITQRRLDACNAGESLRLSSPKYQIGDTVFLEGPEGDRVRTEVLTISNSHGHIWAILIRPEDRTDKTIYLRV